MTKITVQKSHYCFSVHVCQYIVTLKVKADLIPNSHLLPRQGKILKDFTTGSIVLNSLTHSFDSNYLIPCTTITNYIIFAREQPEELGIKRKSCPKPTHITLNEWRHCYLPYFYSAVFVSMVSPWRRGKWRQPGQSQLHSLHPVCFPSFFPNCLGHSQYLHPLKISIEN